MARLLIFLVNKTMTGAERETSEYAIGIEVFDKDPATYSTYEGSVVRVQIKRLRCKLLEAVWQNIKRILQALFSA
jgi:hypothetical protein